PDENLGLAEHWDGSTWTDVPTPAFPDPISGTLVDVSGTSATDVWAVGSSGLDSFRDKQIAIEHWNGSSWSMVNAPNASFNDRLFGVTAISPSNAWAVGGYDTGGTALNHMLIEHWNGATWSIVPTPESPNSPLNAVDAVSATDIWAVGGGGGQTFTMHYDGTAWSPVPSPNRGAAVQSLSDVSAPGSTNVWAVGTVHAGQPFTGQTLAMHWDGTAWRLTNSPTPSSGDAVNGVSALPTGEAWMVGYYFPDAFTQKPLTEHFGRRGWKVVPAPGLASLDGVAMLSSSNVWAVGSAIYHWDGASWAIVVPSG
ncbi:MAG TPA: hypothetical protein VKA30_07390, partial [Actinomycetota bacterium]|nr:hypothetical protein [Actinomycetota bacterium]